MNWYPSTGLIPSLALIWPSGIATTSLSLAAFSACVQLSLLVLRAARARARAVSVPSPSLDFIDEQEVTKTAA
jgi:hypothetical protein